MFERLTDRARRVVILSQEEARTLNHGHIGTEHVLLGLLREGEAVAAKVLESLGVGLEGARGKVAELRGRGETAPTGHLPFTTRAAKVLELSNTEAAERGVEHIGTEHLLLALLREGTGTGVQVLTGLGVEPVRAGQAVEELLRKYRPAGS